MNVNDIEYWKECADNNAKRANRYYCLLKDEHHLRTRITSPWACTNGDCPNLGKPADKHCACFMDMQREHMRQIAALPGEAES